MTVRSRPPLASHAERGSGRFAVCGRAPSVISPS